VVDSPYAVVERSTLKAVHNLFSSHTWIIGTIRKLHMVERREGVAAGRCQGPAMSNGPV